jgi:hypothetical protein
MPVDKAVVGDIVSQVEFEDTATVSGSCPVAELAATAVDVGVNVWDGGTESEPSS